MGLGDRGWVDRAENYVDGYTKLLTASTADNLLGIDINQPIVVFSVTLSVSQALASGDLVLVDTSATGDAGTSKWRVVVASGVTTDRNFGVIHAAFPRGLAFDSGVVVSGTTVTGSVAITYKARYS